MLDKKNEKSDLQGVTHLIKESIIGITDLVEEMQGRIVHPPFLPSSPIQHLITNISKITYKNIRWNEINALYLQRFLFIHILICIVY